MSFSRIALAVAFATGLTTAVTSAQAVEQPRRDCGWVLQNGKYVFLSPCPEESSEAPSDNGPGSSVSKDAPV